MNVMACLSPLLINDIYYFATLLSSFFSITICAIAIHSYYTTTQLANSIIPSMLNHQYTANIRLCFSPSPSSSSSSSRVRVLVLPRFFRPNLFHSSIYKVGLCLCVFWLVLSNLSFRIVFVF